MFIESYKFLNLSIYDGNVLMCSRGVGDGNALRYQQHTVLFIFCSVVFLENTLGEQPTSSKYVHVTDSGLCARRAK